MHRFRIAFLFLSAFQMYVFASNRLDELLRTLETHRDYKVRIAAANQLGKISDGSVVPYLVTSFTKNNNHAVRLAILVSIAQIPDSRVIDGIAGLLIQNKIQNLEEENLARRVLRDYADHIDQQMLLARLANSSITEDKVRILNFLFWSQIKLPMASLERLVADHSPLVRRAAVRLLPQTENAALTYQWCTKLLVTEKAASVAAELQSCVQNKGYMTILNVASVRRTDRESVAGGTFSYERLRRISEEVNWQRESDLLAHSQKSSPSQQRSWMDVAYASPQPTKLSSHIAVSEFYSSDIDRLKSSVAKLHPQINGCYEKSVKRFPGLAGFAVLKIRVGRSGDILRVKAVEEQWNQTSDIQQCLTQTLLKTKFQSMQTDEVELDYKVEFKGKYVTYH